jgi:hypothetical protein
MVRAKGLEPPQACAYQDLNLGRLVPSSPVWSHGVRLDGGFREVVATFIPSCWVAIGLQSLGGQAAWPRHTAS